MQGDQQAPNPTVGQHFGSLLLCPQRAWLDYHGDRSQKASPPGFLGKLQQEGLAHERDIYANRFPDAVKIPSDAQDERRARLTLEAMQQGVPAILQAFFMTKEGRGVADVAQLVATSPNNKTGHLYRIGEIKSSSAISTAHALQVAWYHELLEGIQGPGIDDAFFILRDGQRQSISITDLKTAFEHCKAELRTLQAHTTAPGPHLCRWCNSCPWRNVCIPDLLRNQDVSLLPGINRSQANRLRDHGASSWSDVIKLGDDLMQSLGFTNRELWQIRSAGERIGKGLAVLNRDVRAESLMDLRAVAVELHKVEGKVDQSQAKAIWFETGTGTSAIEVGNGTDWADAVAELIQERRVALYGATETVGFLKLLQSVGLRPPAYVDVLDLVENLVHGPLLGLDLDSVLELAAPSIARPAYGRYRVTGLRAVINWIAGLPGTAA
jgi:hypothetical protein